MFPFALRENIRKLNPFALRENMRKLKVFLYFHGDQNIGNIGKKGLKG